MTLINVACPSGFTLLTEPVRGCKQAPGQGPVCISAVFSSGGLSYSRVCGRVNGYQKGTTDAFHLSAGLRTLEQSYVEGVSLTHGAPSSRQHIWTFAAALYETTSPYNPNYNCPCTNTEEDWPFEVYSYVGNNYFCATGNPGPGYTTGSIIYACGMERGVVPLMPAVSSTTRHGSAQHCHSLLQTTSR